MNTRTILGGGLLLTVCGAAAIYGGSVVAFFHLAGLLLVLGVTVAGTLIAVPTANLSAALSRPWSAHRVGPDDSGGLRVTGLGSISPRQAALALPSSSVRVLVVDEIVDRGTQGLPSAGSVAALPFTP